RRVEEREDLAPARVDHRHRPGRACGERVEGRDPGDRKPEREREPAGGREPDPDAGEAARPRTDDERLEVARLRARRGEELVRVRLGPLDEDDRAVEVRLEVAPLGRRDALEPEEVEVRDENAALVAVPDRVRRARNRPLDAEPPAGAADEGRLAGAELAGDGD